MSLHTQEMLLYGSWTMKLLLLGLTENFPKEDFPWENDLQDLKVPGKT